MGFISSLRRLLRHHDFRRLFTIRALTQTADGTLQIGMASHVLFNPASQPTAWSIAAMFAVTLMPFSIVGPFVSGLLDRWSRRNVAVVVDLTRTVLALATGACLIWTNRTEAPASLVLQGNVDIREVDLAFRQPGRLASLKFDEGTTVKQGQLLAELDAKLREIYSALNTGFESFAGGKKAA